MGWKDHKESGEEVRSIRDWGFMKSKDRDDGGKEIIYDSEPRDTAAESKHGHYGEDANGESDSRNRSPSS